MAEETDREKAGTQQWEDPDIDLERAKANGAKWKDTGKATAQTMKEQYEKAKRIFDA